MEGWRKPAPALVMGAFVKGRQESVTVEDGAEWNRNGGKKKKNDIEAYRGLAVNEVGSMYKYI